MGASGAIFGLYGGTLALLLLRRHTVPGHYVSSIAKGAAIFIGVNLAYGLTQSNVDVAAHVGGLIVGFLLGCGLTGPLVPADPDWRQRRSFVVALLGIAVAVVCFLRLPVVDDWRSDLNRLIALDANNQRLYSEALRNLQSHRTTAADFALVIERKLIPPWNAERENLTRLKLSKQQRAIADQLVNYMSLRSDAWNLMKTAVDNTDPKLARESYRKQAAAESVLRTINQQLAPAKPSGGS
jgi:hypothetical protein